MISARVRPDVDVALKDGHPGLWKAMARAGRRLTTIQELEEVHLKLHQEMPQTRQDPFQRAFLFIDLFIKDIKSF